MIYYWATRIALYGYVQRPIIRWAIIECHGLPYMVKIKR